MLALLRERYPDPGVAVIAPCHAGRGREIGPDAGRYIARSLDRPLRLVALLASVRSALDDRATGRAEPGPADASMSISP